MVALVLRRAVSSSSLSARSPSLCVFDRHLSTFAAIDHPALVNSALEKSETFPHLRADPRMPIPDGFPFTVRNNVSTLSLLRQDKDEKIKVDVDLARFHLVDGNPCFLMSCLIERGYWELDLEFFAGPKTLIVSTVKLSDIRERNFPCFQEFLKSRGINKELMTSLLSFWTN